MVMTALFLFGLFKKHFRWLESPPLLHENCGVLCYCGAHRGQGRQTVVFNSESKQHVLPAGLRSLLGHANPVALNTVVAQGPG